MQSSSLSSLSSGLSRATTLESKFEPIAERPSDRHLYRLDTAAEAKADRQKETAERKFRAAFLRQLLEPLTEQLLSSSGASSGVGSGMETYRFFLEEALAGQLEQQWPLPELDLDPAGAAARRASDVQRAAASYAGPSIARAISTAAPRLPTLSNSSSVSSRAAHTPTAQFTRPGLNRVTGADDLARYIESAAEAASLPDSLLRAVVEVESGGRSEAVSPAGAQGLMQLMPTTAAELGVTNPFDPKQNLEGGARYLAEQLDRFDGDLRLALAAYNAGPGAVKRHGGVPPYPETERYVESVLQWKAHFESQSEPGDSPTATPPS